MGDRVPRRGEARQLSRQIQDGYVPARFLIRDRDRTFSAAFYTLFSSEDVTIIRTPIQAPDANALAERWMRSIREECLDKLLILGERHPAACETPQLEVPQQRLGA